jgi:hypothetical protein
VIWHYGGVAHDAGLAEFRKTVDEVRRKPAAFQAGMGESVKEIRKPDPWLPDTQGELDQEERYRELHPLPVKKGLSLSLARLLHECSSLKPSPPNDAKLPITYTQPIIRIKILKYNATANIH